jgi:hypothetical protein
LVEFWVDARGVSDVLQGGLVGCVGGGVGVGVGVGGEEWLFGGWGWGGGVGRHEWNFGDSFVGFGMCGTVYGVKILNFGGVGFWAGKIILGDFFFEGLIKDGASILRENIKKSKISLENF